MIPRSSKPLKRTPLPKRTKAIRKRSRSKAERERIYGPPGYVEWIHEQPCIACEYPISECAHIQTGGTGRKDDWTRTVPLCGPRDSNCGCHQWLHIEGRRDWEEWTGIDLERAAEFTHLCWSEFSGASSVLEDTKT